MISAIFTEKDIRNKLLTKQYTIGFHTMKRIEESNILNVVTGIRAVAKYGTVIQGFNHRGVNQSITAFLDGAEYRLFVEVDIKDRNKLFIITFYKAEAGVAIGTNHRKFSDRELIYEFDFTEAA